jgi:hypothetical protein
MRFAIVLAILGCAAGAEAKPMHTPLDAILKTATTIVIAKLEPIAGKPHEATSYTLTVERALRGTAKPGPLVVKPSRHGHAYLAAGTRVLAFIDAKSEWLAFGVAFAGPSLEDGVIRLAGFYDHNAHLVSPGVVTLSELEGLVAKGTPMKWRFKGPVMVASKTGLVASKIQLTADLQTGTVTGWPTLAGFPAKPVMYVGSWEGRDLSITYRAASDRPLELEARALGKLLDGTIAVELHVREPDALTEADLMRYVGDAKLGHPYYELSLDLGAKQLAVVLGKETGRIGTIGSDAITSTSMSPTRELHTAAGKVVLAATGYKSLAFGTTAMLIDEAITGPLACTYTVTAGNPVPCKLRYVATKFVPN